MSPFTYFSTSALSMFYNFFSILLYSFFIYIIFISCREFYYESKLGTFKKVKEYIKNSFILSKDSIKLAWNARRYRYYIKHMVKNLHEYNIHIHVIINKISNIIKWLHNFAKVHYLTILKITTSLIEFLQKSLNVKEYVENMK